MSHTMEGILITLIAYAVIALLFRWIVRHEARDVTREELKKYIAILTNTKKEQK